MPNRKEEEEACNGWGLGLVLVPSNGKPAKHGVRQMPRTFGHTGIRTPWGYADNIEKIGDGGLVFYSTPSHGGFFVPSDLLKTMPKELIDGKDNQFRSQRRRGWFEEDCDAFLVIVAFPRLFSTDAWLTAKNAVAYWHGITV